MKTRKIGKQIEVGAVGLGCMGMSSVYGGQDEGEAIKTLHRAIELGVTLFDTAEAYGPHTNETLLGKALKPHRQKVVIASKFGFEIVDRGNGPEETGNLDGTPENVRASVEGSLKRLGVDVIDIYYLHRVDPEVPIEDTVGAMAELVQQGKVRAIGLSEVSAATLRRAHRVHPIAAVESEYSLWTREPEVEILPLCRELGVSFVPFSPLGRGMLTGALRTLDALDKDDFRRTLPRFDPANFDRNVAVVTSLENLASAKGYTAAQLALAWVLHQGDFIVPVPGARKIPNLEQNVVAADIVLDAADADDIGSLLSPETVSGERYSDEHLQLVNR
ncbi:MAG: aldo/keto reductase [Mesorhizobium sp.]|uniref:aldo/keto reductase n=1 Tax=Mesorhizobium sp. TaxID=1871066 RepID=UPI001AC91A43|nr:aldo/keto reductase [Mesorhizobium sp.]MBN9221253.1 aldo/keto reductase [Mesorhizobium sp.]